MQQQRAQGKYLTAQASSAEQIASPVIIAPYKKRSHNWCISGDARQQRCAHRLKQHGVDLQSMRREQCRWHLQWSLHPTRGDCIAGALSLGRGAAAMSTSIQATRSWLTQHASNSVHVASPMIVVPCKIRRCCGWCTFSWRREAAVMCTSTRATKRSGLTSHACEAVQVTLPVIVVPYMRQVHGWLCVWVVG
jgi:hypothetical protein